MEDAYGFDEFVALIARLRDPEGGCPWDLEQTHRSIAKNMVEEAYEAVHAIETDDVAGLREELGDVLLQVVLQSQIAADADEFTVAEVVEEIRAKIVRRHPHVFGEATAGTPTEVITKWDEIKRADLYQKLLDDLRKKAKIEIFVKDLATKVNGSKTTTSTK